MTETPPASSSPQEMTLIDHLSELRSRLIRVFIFVGVAFCFAWAFKDEVFTIIREPIMPFLEGGLVFTGPMDKFLAYIKVAFLASLVLSCPFWVYEIWRFVAPALYKSERKAGMLFIFSGSLLFLTGISFVYFVVYPMTFDFLMNFGTAEDKPMITISEYLSFFFLTSVAFGLAFEMPLVLTILGMLGVIDHKFLSSKRRYAIVIMAALSAMITPPDVLSMVFLLGPLILLYEVSIFLVRYLAPKAL